MATVTLEVAQATLAELIRALPPGAVVVITDNERAVATLFTPPAPPPPPGEAPKPRKLGTMAGTVLSMEHFDDPLDDFAEYM